MDNTSSLTEQTQPLDGVLLLRINRPEVMNALNTLLLQEIADTLTSVADDNTIRTVVITGNDRAFAAGADIEELQLAAKGQFPENERQSAWEAIRKFPKPIIAAVSGYALGGGCELMMTADIVVASKTAIFGQPEIKLGIIPGAGGTQRLTAAVGKAAAMKLNLTGEFLDAEEGLRLGLISELTEPELYLERSLTLAGVIAQHATTAAQAVKSTVNHFFESELEEGLRAERDMFLQVVTTPDAHEGIQAFLDKRRPDFPGNRQ